MEWTTWKYPRGQRVHTAGGSYDGEPGNWEIGRQHGTLEVWFRPSGLGPKRKRARKGRFICTAKTLAEAKQKVDALG